MNKYASVECKISASGRTVETTHFGVAQSHSALAPGLGVLGVLAVFEGL